MKSLSISQRKPSPLLSFAPFKPPPSLQADMPAPQMQNQSNSADHVAQKPKQLAKPSGLPGFAMKLPAL